MSRFSIALVFLIYGLAFVAMGLILILEGGRASDKRLRNGLRPLAAFGLIHGVHEWVEMFHRLGLLPSQAVYHDLWDALRLAMLVFSFLSLSAFGASLLSPNDKIRRISLLLPLAQVSVWAVGVLLFQGQEPSGDTLWVMADVWARYTLGIPGALIASLGLIAQQRAFRQANLPQFGRDSLWAAVAFAWYGLVGQIFVQATPFPPSHIINQALFQDIFGFPVQLLRAATAVFAAFFVVRSLQAFEVESRRKIEQLQAEKVAEAERQQLLQAKLLGQVVAAQEAERQRIARELHDETGQALTAIGMGMRGIASMLEQDVGRARSNLRQMEGLAVHSLNELQRLISDLRPSHLDDLGLPAALRWWANETEERTGMEVAANIVGQERPISSPVKIALFRIAQEALTNVVKHAGASRAWVSLVFDQAFVKVEVRDNGHGFDRQQTGEENGRPAWGLLGMEERAALLDGEFTLASWPGQGTLVTVTIPCQTEWDDNTTIPLETIEETPHDNPVTVGG